MTVLGTGPLARLVSSRGCHEVLFVWCMQAIFKADTLSSYNYDMSRKPRLQSSKVNISRCQSSKVRWTRHNCSLNTCQRLARRKLDCISLFWREMKRKCEWTYSRAGKIAICCCFSPFWDVVVLSSGDEEQKTSYRQQITLKKSRNEIPGFVKLSTLGCQSVRGVSNVLFSIGLVGT